MDPKTTTAAICTISREGSDPVRKKCQYRMIKGNQEQYTLPGNRELGLVQLLGRRGEAEHEGNIVPEVGAGGRH